MERSFNVDELFLLALQLDLPSIINFCKTSKKINEKICRNENFWRQKVNQDFPGFINRQNTFKEQYVFLTRILPKGNVPKIFPGTNRDLYDLLYSQFRNKGIIIVNKGKLIFELGLLSNILGSLEDIDASFDRFFDELGGYQKFISEVKQGKYHDLIGQVWDENIGRYPDLYDTPEKYIESLSTLEERLQDYIIQNTNEDVREEINQKVSPYNEDEIEFLQILHDGIRIRKLKIFDPVDYNFLINKLRQK